jgi:ubiquinone/menaquinone biosynthesis C-methylase UbiE
MRRAERAIEYLDRPLPAAVRDASLADMHRLNAWFGGYALTLAALRRVARRVSPSRPLVVVDVGGGRGDFARRLLARARWIGRSLRVVVVDRDPDLLAGAAATRAQHPGLSLVRADAAALPFRERGVDIVTMSLTLHHLEPTAATGALAEMSTVARVAVIVNDLLRTRLALALVWVGTRLLGCHRISRHDGPLSVRRAYSPEELRTLAERAGIDRLRIARHPELGRLVAVIDA